MPILDAAQHIARDFSHSAQASDLDDVLDEVRKLLGCSFLALSHHVDFLGARGSGLRVHNHPEDRAHWFDSERSRLSDPEHRASQQTSAGYSWRNLLREIPLAPPRPHDLRPRPSPRGSRRADDTRACPERSAWSCSFAWARGAVQNPDALVFTQSIANFAFEAARRIRGRREAPRQRLTDRQRECVLWAARYKTDWEISQIMGIGHMTVVDHIHHARGRYDAATRAMLIVRARFDGTLHFGDIARR